MKELQQKVYMWKGRMQEMHARRDILAKNVAQSKNFMKEKDVIIDFLEKLQHKEHERAVGKFERWLTSLLQEVFGVKNQRILLDLHTDYNKVGLDILLEKDGEIEDLYSGNGGAYTNLIATGLRLIATAVTQRAFLVLDEPDCWVRGDILPNFINVITRYSRELGIQVILISHHTLTGMADREFILDNDGKKTWISDIKDNHFGFEEENEHTKINSIRLKNFMQYEDVVFELSPYINLFTGPNNIAKSGVVQGLRCVFYNEKPHNFIRHGENVSDIFIHFNTKQELRYTAKKTKSLSKVIWRLIDPNAPDAEKSSEDERNKDDPENMILKTTGTKSFPDWVEKISAIGLIDEIDIQLGLQKKPSSVLEGTPNERAMVLSLNKESSYAQKMMDEFKSKCKNAQEIIKNGEDELTDIDQKLKADPFVMSLDAKVSSLENDKEEIDEKTQMKNWAADVLNIWKENVAISDLPVLKKVKLPKIEDRMYWENSCETWKQSQKLKDLPSINLPVYEDIVKSQKRIDQVVGFSFQLINWKQSFGISKLPIFNKVDMINPLINVNYWAEILSDWQVASKYKNVKDFKMPALLKHPVDLTHFEEIKNNWKINIFYQNIDFKLPAIISQPTNIEYWQGLLEQWDNNFYNNIKIDIPDINRITNNFVNQEWSGVLLNWEQLSKSFSNYENELIFVDDQKTKVNQQMIMWEKACGNICPLCKTSLSKNINILHNH